MDPIFDKNTDARLITQFCYWESWWGETRVSNRQYLEEACLQSREGIQCVESEQSTKGHVRQASECHSIFSKVSFSLKLQYMTKQSHSYNTWGHMLRVVPEVGESTTSFPWWTPSMTTFRGWAELENKVNEPRISLLVVRGLESLKSQEYQRL